ncbi:dehydrogenase/reductase SDR family member 11, partial [Asbolus verrucosus]
MVLSMERWVGKVAIVTGASEGIGAAIVDQLVEYGLISTTLHDGNIDDWRYVINLNFMAVCIGSKEAIRVMRENQINGHIINVNSIYGHRVPSYPGINMYSPAKHALTCYTEYLRREFNSIGCRIKLTSSIMKTQSRMSVSRALSPVSHPDPNTMVLSMDRWVGKVAVVTGASAGIGAAIVDQLVANGVVVVGIARRADLIEQRAEELADKPGKLHAYKADLTKEEEIVEAFKWIDENIGPLHILVNNVGSSRDTTLYDGDTEAWKSVLDLNVLSLCIASREAIKLMRLYDIDGHIVHINSIFGHKVPNFVGLNIYPASKFAVTALAESLRQELNSIGSKIKISSVSPGVVASELTSQNPDPEKRAMYENMPILEAENIADGVIYVLSTPEDVQVYELTIKPVGEWVGKVAVVTGASSGIGASTADALVENGLIVVGLARRVELIEERSKQLSGKKGKLYAVKADITREEEILKAFKWVGDNLGPVHILINNAGYLKEGSLSGGRTEDWKKQFDINVLGLCIATREAVRIMRANDVKGHIVHINSIAGHAVAKVPNLNVYPATKFAVTALTETLRQELNSLQSEIKITSVSPGLVYSEMTVLNKDNTEERRKMIESRPILQPEDITNGIVYVLSTPEHVQVRLIWETENNAN